MKPFLTLLSSLSVVFLLSACDRSTVSSGGAQLTLVRPANQTLTRGRTNDILIAIQRSGMTHPVTVDFTNLPKGVKVATTPAEIPGTDSSKSFTLHAEPSADLVSNHRTRVTAKAKDVSVSEEFEITVKE